MIIKSKDQFVKNTRFLGNFILLRLEKVLTTKNKRIKFPAQAPTSGIIPVAEQKGAAKRREIPVEKSC